MHCHVQQNYFSEYFKKFKLFLRKVLKKNKTFCRIKNNVEKFLWYVDLQYLNVYIFLLDEKKWWETSPLLKTIETTVNSKPLDIETTAYGLLTYSLRGLVKDSLPIVKWLTAQRNQNGGFQSTQVSILVL